MAYSRFGNSNWYVFWHTSDAKTKDDELLAVWYKDSEVFPVITYGEIKRYVSDTDLLKRRLKRLLKKKDKTIKPKKFEWDELVIYVQKWIENLHETYGKDLIQN